MAIPRSKELDEAFERLKVDEYLGRDLLLGALNNIIHVNHPSMYDLTSPEKGGSDILSKF